MIDYRAPRALQIEKKNGLRKSGAWLVFVAWLVAIPAKMMDDPAILVGCGVASVVLGIWGAGNLAVSKGHSRSKGFWVIFFFLPYLFWFYAIAKDLWELPPDETEMRGGFLNPEFVAEIRSKAGVD
jgi:hypothetical protein